MASLVCTWVLMDAVQTAGLSSSGPEGPDEVVRVITVMGMHLLIVFLPFALLSKNVRATVAVLSNVVGYWPVVHHPLAAPPYRFDVVNTSATQIETIDKPVVLVGHSQGSVLAVDIIKRLGQQDGYKKTHHALVTCGSPLASLYSTYFPHYFPVKDRQATEDLVKEWRNLWRSTDPITGRRWASPARRTSKRSTGVSEKTAPPT